MEKITLKSGQELSITLGSLAEARALYKAIARELKTVGLTDKTELHDAVKNGICGLIGSDEIEEKVWACMRRCLYRGEKITEATFEAAEARRDYLEIQYEVIKANVLPFFESLYSEFLPLLKRAQKAFLG